MIGSILTKHLIFNIDFSLVWYLWLSRDTQSHEIFRFDRSTNHFEAFRNSCSHTIQYSQIPFILSCSLLVSNKFENVFEMTDIKLVTTAFFVSWTKAIKSVQLNRQRELKIKESANIWVGSEEEREERIKPFSKKEEKGAHVKHVMVFLLCTCRNKVIQVKYTYVFDEHKKLKNRKLGFCCVTETNPWDCYSLKNILIRRHSLLIWFYFLFRISIKTMWKQCSSSACFVGRHNLVSLASDLVYEIFCICEHTDCSFFEHRVYLLHNVKLYKENNLSHIDYVVFKSFPKI